MEKQDSTQRQEEDGFTERLRRISGVLEVKMKERPKSPAPSCVSMKSDASMDCAYVFSQGEKSSKKRSVCTEIVRPAPSTPSCGSQVKSDKSVEVNQDEKAQRPHSPAPSCLSMKSDASMDCVYVFSQEEQSSRKCVVMERAAFSTNYVSRESGKMLEIIWNEKESARRLALHSKPSVTMSYAQPTRTMHQEESLCLQHRAPLEVYCKKDQTFICKLCASLEHQGHNTCYTVGSRVERQDSFAPSCVSMKSDASMDCAYVFSLKENTSRTCVDLERPVLPTPSHVFGDNDKTKEINQDNKEIRGNFRDLWPSPRVTQMFTSAGLIRCSEVFRELDTVALLGQTLSKVDKNIFMSYLCQNYPECFENPQVTSDVQDISKLILEKFGCEVALKIAIKIMLEKGRNLKTIQDHLKYKLQHHLKFKFECINEGNAQQGNPILLNDIYTELLITEGGDGGVNKEHEVRLIEEACKNRDMHETMIQCNDIFNPLPGQKKRIRTVLTKGIAGIGKTVSVHKFILDWAEGKENQDIHFIFPLPFRDLNLKGYEKYSLIQLIYQYFPELKELMSVSCEEVKTLFIFDGLDECRLPLDFMNNEMCCDLTKEVSVDVLLTNLIRGNILPSALLWITSRPAAANQIPPECIDRVTEVRGFNDSDREGYFRKRFSDPNLADKIVTHIKSSRSLYIMCHIPVFCWISATVLDQMLGKADIEVPKTLTQMYTHFLIIQTHLKNKKYHGMIQEDIDLTESDKEMILKLGNLAFLQLEKGHLIFYEKDLIECGINVGEASEYSSICTEIFKEEFGLYREKVFCFVHLSIQEHLAAMYVQVKFANNNINVLQKDAENQKQTINMSDLHKSAIDRAMQSENGHFDLFLRFLLGLSLVSNQVLLRGLLSKHCSESMEETVEYIKEKIRKESSAERTINLFHCLNELNYNSLVEEIHSFLRSGRHSETELKPDQCSALAYVLLTSDDVINEFDLKMCNTSLDGYQRLLPVVRNLRRAILAGVNLTDESCETLASILQSANSHLTELDLSFNDLGDLGVKLLCNGLSNPHNKLEKLDFSYNKLELIGVKQLCDCLIHPHCKLKSLGLAGTNFSEQSCELMASVFQSGNSHLEELKLGCNILRDSGVKLLTVGLVSIQCKLETLGLDRCNLTHESCEALKGVLKSRSSHLRELDLSYNKLDVSAVQQLCEGLTCPTCKLEILDLSYNTLSNSGVNLLCAGLMNPDCKIKSIRLADVGLSEDTCKTLALTVQSANPHLRELDLSNNYIGDSGVKLLCAGLISPNSKLEKLSLRWCNVTDRSCTNLATVLSTPTCLTDLELRDNDLHDSGVTLLCTGLQDPHCTLHRLGLSGCCVTKDGCSAVALSLSSDHSQLKELDLSYNNPGDAGVRQLIAVRDDPHCRLEKCSIDHSDECRTKQGMEKYACEITLDPNTAHRTLILTGNKMVTMTKDAQPYPDHPHRFEYYAEVLCNEALIGARFYWEVEWTGDVVYIGVTYKGINRKGRSTDCKLGMNNKSWILSCSNDYGYYVSYNNIETVVPSPPSPSKRMGIYLDWNAGTLSYFIMSAGRLYHTYTFHTTFTEPLYPAIRVYNFSDTVTLCELI